MSDEIRRLLFTGEPYSDESFIGYLLRLTELNNFNRLTWILEFSGLKASLTTKTLPGITSNNNLKILAKLIGIDEKVLKPLTYKINDDIPNKSKPRYILFGKSLPSLLIIQTICRLCPVCLTEKCYLRQLWEFAPITVCLIHRCLLIDFCQKCGKRLIWNRSVVSKCFCGFDFRNAKPSFVPEKELRISQKLYELCGLAESNKDLKLGEYLNDLDLVYFIRFVFFFASFWAGISETSGKSLIYHSSNLDLHKCLNFVAVIFDDFPRNFYVFLDWIKYQNILYLGDKVRAAGHYLREDHEQGVIEWFRISLNNEFDSPQFDFLHEAFKKYVKSAPKDFGPRNFFYTTPEVLKEVFAQLIKSKKLADN